MLSVCPLSNVKLQVVEDVREVPIRKFLDHGVPFSINSDDPAYFGGYILDNYLAVESRFNLTGEEWVLIAKNGVAGSWIEEDRKREINEAIDAVYGKYKHLI
jgi:adenosine deaminase